MGTGQAAGRKSTSEEAKREILERPLFLFHFSLAVGEYQWSVTASSRSTDLKSPCLSPVSFEHKIKEFICCLFIRDSRFSRTTHHVHKLGGGGKTPLCRELQGFPVFNLCSIFKLCHLGRCDRDFAELRYCFLGFFLVLFYLLESVKNPFVCARLMC